MEISNGENTFSCKLIRAFKIWKVLFIDWFLQKVALRIFKLLSLELWELILYLQLKPMLWVSCWFIKLIRTFVDTAIFIKN